LVLDKKEVRKFKISFKHSFAQYTTITADDTLLNKLAPGADTFSTQLNAIKKAKKFGLKHVVARFDPIIPFLTDSDDHLKEMARKVRDAGANHVILSCMDIPYRVKSKYTKFFENLVNIENFLKIYKNDQFIAGDLNANSDYRRQLFARAQNIIGKLGMTFALCMEFDKKIVGGKEIYEGFNDNYMTSSACEGIDIPIYIRYDLKNKFRPMNNCDGNCLSEAKPHVKSKCKGVCKFKPFTMATGNTLKQYRDFGKRICSKNVDESQEKIVRMANDLVRKL